MPSSGLATPDTSATEVNELAAARDAILESEAQPSASVVLGGSSLLCAVVGGAFRWRKALANAFIRPPKTEYDAAKDLGAARSIVGTHAVHPGARERVVTRVDFVLPGTAGLLQVISVVHGLNTTSCTIVKICSTAGCYSIVYKTHVSYNIGLYYSSTNMYTVAHIAHTSNSASYWYVRVCDVDGATDAVLAMGAGA